MVDLSFALFETAAAWDEQGALARFRRALRRADQLVLDDLFSSVSPKPGMAFLSELSVETALLTALLEEQKELLRLREALREIDAPQTEDG